MHRSSMHIIVPSLRLVKDFFRGCKNKKMLDDMRKPENLDSPAATEVMKFMWVCRAITASVREVNKQTTP
jgi:hypothetical protein